MRSKVVIFLALSSILLVGARTSVLRVGAAPPEVPVEDLVVHEWGTFLAMGGSDGVALDGMYHEEHALPGFVHARSRDQLRAYNAFSKGETPVIYFYTGRAQNVRVSVRFPLGLWTQWYPAAAGVFPRFGEMATADTLRDGRIVWRAGIIPAGKGPAPLLPATSGDALWNFARQVDAAYVQTLNPAKAGPAARESERFLFYRGLGATPLPIRFSAEGGGTLASPEEGGVGVRHVFLIRVEGGKAAYSYRPGLKAGEAIRGVIPSLDGARPVAEVGDALADDLAARLVASGLYEKEARAMVNTWRSSYFQSEGVRALFVMPQSWTDGLIPLEVTPRPKETVRVMVGRLELLTPARERLAEAAVADLASPDPARRLAAFDTLRSQGRYVEPIVRRLLKATTEEGVRKLCRKLLLAEFVTDLRSAVRTGPDPEALPPGLVLNDDKLQMRAQLASLLRAVGLDDEAKSEGAATLAGLGKRAPARPDTCPEKEDLKLAARAFEGLGDDREAARRYGRLIDLAALATRTNDCRKCHQNAGPLDASRLRDWWAGDGYARSLERAGERDAAIAELRATAARSSPPADTGALLRLAYLAESRKRRDEAEAIWAKLGARGTELARSTAAPVPSGR